MNEKIVLIYTGGGYGGFLPNIPARDLTAQELEDNRWRVEDLLASGLYAKPEIASQKTLAMTKTKVEEK